MQELKQGTAYHTYSTL